MVEEIIIRSIQDNQPSFQGEDVYQSMLLRKAKAHYKLRQFEACEYTLIELLRMAPHQAEYLKLLGKSWYHQKPDWLKTVRAFSIAIFLITAIITSLEVLFVTPFTPDWTDEIQMVRNSTFGISLFLLIGSELLHRWGIRRKMHNYRQNAEQRKIKKERNQSV